MIEKITNLCWCYDNPMSLPNTIGHCVGQTFSLFTGSLSLGQRKIFFKLAIFIEHTESFLQIDNKSYNNTQFVSTSSEKWQMKNSERYCARIFFSLSGKRFCTKTSKSPLLITPDCFRHKSNIFRRSEHVWVKQHFQKTRGDSVYNSTAHNIRVKEISCVKTQYIHIWQTNFLVCPF